MLLTAFFLAGVHAQTVPVSNMLKLGPKLQASVCFQHCGKKCHGDKHCQRNCNKICVNGGGGGTSGDGGGGYSSSSDSYGGGYSSEDLEDPDMPVLTEHTSKAGESAEAEHIPTDREKAEAEHSGGPGGSDDGGYVYGYHPEGTPEPYHYVDSSSSDDPEMPVLICFQHCKEKGHSDKSCYKICVKGGGGGHDISPTQEPTYGGGGHSHSGGPYDGCVGNDGIWIPCPYEDSCAGDCSCTGSRKNPISCANDTSEPPHDGLDGGGDDSDTSSNDDTSSEDSDRPVLTERTLKASVCIQHCKAKGHGDKSCNKICVKGGGGGNHGGYAPYDDSGDGYGYGYDVVDPDTPGNGRHNAITALMARLMPVA